MKKQPKSTRIMIWGISSLVALLFVAGAVGAIKLLLSDDGSKRKRQIKMVTLIKPPPPPKVKEKPPEPEIKKQEEIVEQKQDEPEPDPMDDMAEDDGPMDDDLGLDADGAGAADGFGLRAKKGGRSLIGGGYGQASLMRKYAWYTRILQDELRKKINQHMEDNGGTPDGNLSVQIKVTLDEMGRITDLALSRPSGNEMMDEAVNVSLMMATICEPPPEGMPRTVKLKISSKG